MNCTVGKGCSREDGGQGRLHLEVQHLLSFEEYATFHVEEKKARESREITGNGAVSKELVGL